MIVLVVERVKPGLRGQLTRWLLEVRAGVFVGTVSSRVRDYIWEQVEGKVGDGSAVLIWSATTEQGFAMRAIGDNSREIFDNEGLRLIRFKSNSAPGDIPGKNA